MHHFLKSKLPAIVLAASAALGSFASPCIAQVETISAEPELIAILASDDAPRADKAMACKRLTVYGSPAAVPELAKLLSDAELASWTRIALEAIPGSEADSALRDACASLTGKLLVGTINSIGVRRDQAAVEMLTGQLKNSDPQAAVAAAFALGKIGGADATSALLAALASDSETVRSAVAASCVLCAEQALAAGDATGAVEVYDQVRSAEVPQQRIVEATRGAMIAQGADGIPLLVETLRSQERKLFYVALQTAREMPSQELAAALLAEVASASPDRAPLIVQALADMPGTVDVQTIVELAATAGSKEVRVAAIDAIGRTGDASCVAPLLKIATESEDLVAPVKAALVNIPDEAVNQEVVTRLPEAQGDVDAQLLIEVVGLRRIEATDALVKALDSSRPAVRHAALESLGRTVAPERLDLLVKQVVSPKHSEDFDAAVTALKTGAIRMPDREAAAGELSAAVKDAPTAAQVAILEILGSMGGPHALKTLAGYGGGDNVNLKDVSSRLMGEWMTADAAPVLLKLATTGPADKFQVRAMRGYIRIARQFVMPESERVAMCAEAMQACKQDTERKMVLEVLQRYPSRGTLKLAIEATQSGNLRNEAKTAAQKIGEKLKDDAEAQGMLKKAGL
jgi:HEAT repeat protein